ncbi:hypothetical protein HYW21_03080 [Candidatus Woesearchaeota archaeon]|nr:hypothetical protein [Candidatus Woesearchaeota archaeon]
MKRKVIQQGNNTLTITLPKQWTQQCGITTKTEVDVEERGNTLLISSFAENRKTAQQITIDITGLDYSSVRHELRSSYKVGADEITVLFKNPLCENFEMGTTVKTIDAIKREVGMLVGFEIVEERKDHAIIKDISESSLKDFDDILRRIFLLIRDYIAQVMEAVEKMDTSLLATMEEKHDGLTKFTNFCLRILYRAGYKDYRKTIFLYHIITGLDEIVDVYRLAARHLLTFKQETLDKKTKLLMKDIQKAFEEYHLLFYELNKERIMHISRSRWNNFAKITELQGKIPTNELILVTLMHHCYDILVSLVESRVGMEL